VGVAVWLENERCSCTHAAACAPRSPKSTWPRLVKLDRLQ
jgi:hypothetical protein